jgi:hypothetical protein
VKENAFSLASRNRLAKARLRGVERNNCKHLGPAVNTRIILIAGQIPAHSFAICARKLSNFRFCSALRLLWKAINFGFSAFMASSLAYRKLWLKIIRSSRDDRSGSLSQSLSFASLSDFTRASWNSLYAARCTGLNLRCTANRSPILRRRASSFCLAQSRSNSAL